MEENTPNSTNPLVGPTPETGRPTRPIQSVQSGQSTQPIQPIQPIQSEQNAQSSQTDSITQPVQPIQSTEIEQTTQPAQSTIASGSVTTDQSSASAQPVASGTQPPKKKVGLIVAIIIGALALIGGGIAVAAFLLPPKDNSNPVAKAMERIMGGQTSANVAIDGDISILNNSQSSPISRINIKLDSDISVGTMINTSSAVLTITTTDNKDASVKFDEVYAEDGSLYFKADGLENIADLELDESVAGMIDSFSTLDDTWLRFSPEVFSTIANPQQESTISCITNMVTELDKTSSSTKSLYQKYPFITSTTENVVIPKKNSQVYQVSLDSEKLSQFISEIENTDIIKDAYNCFGYENAPSITSSDIAKIVNKLPKTYVEVNSNNDFSRLYLESDILDGNMSMTIDLNFNYINKVTADEPIEYTDFTTMIQQIMSNFYITETSEESYKLMPLAK